MANVCITHFTDSMHAYIYVTQTHSSICSVVYRNVTKYYTPQEIYCHMLLLPYKSSVPYDVILHKVTPTMQVIT